MQKAYDTILCDYVDADVAAKSSSNEPYRYKCARCWEEVHLCAANSRNQVTHFRHRSSNNNVECENYLGNRKSVIRNALYQRNARDKIEFYFSSVTKMFNMGVKFNAKEIAAYEQNDTILQIKTSFTSKPILTIPINSSRFLPDISELIPIDNFSWEYYVSSTNDSNQRRYEIFHKDKHDNLFPSLFKVLANGDEDNFKAKLVRTETIYTNTPYLIIFTHQYGRLNFSGAVKIGKMFNFTTMGRDFSGFVVTFTKKTVEIEQQLEKWKYKLESNENLTLLWPPAPQIDDTMVLKEKYAYIVSSFELQAHGNINVHTKDIEKLEDGVSKVFISDQTKIYKKNAELLLATQKTVVSEYDAISIIRETSQNFVAPDDNPFLFNSFGVAQMSEGMLTSLTPKNEIRHFWFGYLDRVIIAENKVDFQDGRCILKDILMYYKIEEDFNRADYESLNLSSIAEQYIESCAKSGKINSAAKRLIKEGRI